MAPHPKVCQAFRATRALGIPDEEVKPVLKNLLKLYEKNWEFIEEDNYRTLIDSYYENKRTSDGNGSATRLDDSERPAKRSRLEEKKNKASSSSKDSESVDVTSSEEDDKIPNSRQTMLLPQSRSIEADGSGPRLLHCDIRMD
ncbi:probable inactive histone-lysine N-methyltransferase SUVR2, partial [Punica granatum]|uniref:Probable inactive histone-lysine N-methyltransferase SUVR2 n=1 Tax=Punica granatum TaxID=22663 RepID=A0A6P8DQT2_PUNGR